MSIGKYQIFLKTVELGSFTAAAGFTDILDNDKYAFLNVNCTPFVR